MLANHPQSRSERRGIVLVLVLAMLGLLALIGVTFATFAGQSRINARNFAQSLIQPQDDELMDYALSQLINDTADPRSAIRGHSLARDMYGNDGYGNGYLPLNPSTGLPFFIQTVTASGGALYTLTTNIASNDSNFYGYNFTRWIMKVGYNGSLSTTTPLYNGTGTVFQTFEILQDTGYNSGSGAARTFTVAILDTSTTLTNYNATTNYPYGFSTALPAYFLNNILANSKSGTTNNLGSTFPFALDGRWLHAFNGAGMGYLSQTITINGTNVTVPNSVYGNFRYNAGMNVPGPGVLGMDEDYDACDLENWFLALQSADGQVMIPSFHRPAIVRYDPSNSTAALQANDWGLTASGTNFRTQQGADSFSRILRPVANDGNDALTFPDLIPNATTGKINYDVDNDGDGVTDSVWVDLGYPARRDSRGQLYKPLFAFMVIGLNGRIPLNTAGNLAGSSSGTGNYHANHLGNSVSEIDPSYALQNGFNPVPTINGNTYYDPSAAFAAPQIGVTVGTNQVYPLYSQTDNTVVYSSTVGGNVAQGTDVRLTQLRNLLAGTRAQPTPTTAVSPLNSDNNYVNVGGGSYFLPNGVADYSDSYGTDSVTGNIYATRLVQPTAGRWGEGQAVPGIPFTDPSGNNQYLGVLTTTYGNPVRAGYSEDIGDILSGNPRDAADDNFNSFDPYPAYDTVTLAQRTGEVDDQDAYDAAGAYLLPIDRIRRWVTPADINGTGAIRTWSASGSAGPGSNRGADAFGRVEYYSYFRPPGAPGAINVNYTPLTTPVLSTSGLTPYVANTTLGATYYPSSANAYFYNVGLPPGSAASATTFSTYIPDVTNNLLHGFESFKIPILGNGYGGTSNTRPGRKYYDPQDFGGMPADLNPTAVYSAGPPVVQPNPIPTAYPTYNFSVNSNPSVLSDGLNEADEMNLYVPNAQLDSPYGPADLEWLYRQQDVDGASLTSRLSQLAPVSFSNPLDGQRRRRLFALDSWEMNNFVWANDNPRGLFPNNSSFTTGQSASMANLSTNAGSTYVTPSLAHRDKKINLNFPLPVSNDPNEQVRQKWISETYQLLKEILPPKAVDTAEELAQLSQYVINIVDFRDPDCTMTHWINPDVNYVLGSIAGATYTPTTLISTLASTTALPATSQTFPLHQYGMEHSPVAINEAMAYSFLWKSGAAGSYVAAPLNRFFVELVNTLTQANLPAGALYTNPSNLDLGANNYDLVITADDPVSRPDPFTGQLLPISTAVYGGPIPLAASSFSTAGDVVLTALNPANGTLGAANFPGGYFNVIGNPGGQSYTPPGGGTATQAESVLPTVNQTLLPAFDPTSMSANTTGVPVTPAPGALTFNNTTPASANNTGGTSVPLGKANAYPTTAPWMTQVTGGKETYYWVCLRRPASLFLPPNPDPTGASGPYNPMIVVDAMRFPYIEGGGTVTTISQTVTPPDVVKQGGNTMYSIQRQPYRGGHAVRLPGDTGTTTLTLPVNTAYGYSEQSVAPVTNKSGGGGGTYYYGNFGTQQMTQTGSTTGGIFHTLATANDQSGNEPWDWFVFNDRDFTSVAELLLVPGCPPGLFTKQFVELPPMAPAVITAASLAASAYGNFPLVGASGASPPPPPNPGNAPVAITAAPSVPNAYATSALNPSGTSPSPVPQPETHPYLVDKFFYSGASLPTPSSTATGYVAPNTAPLPPYASYDIPYQSVNTAASDGWFKMFEFFEIPSQMIGAIGPVAQGNNFDWTRQDSKPGLLNLNLIIDEEVFMSVLGKQTYTASNATSGYDSFLQSLMNFTQLTLLNGPGNIPKVANTSSALGVVNGTYSMLGLGQAGVITNDYINPAVYGTQVGLTATTTGTANNGMKAAFAQFLWLRHGGQSLFSFKGERPFHSLSFPNIDLTVMRPATVHTGTASYTGATGGYATVAAGGTTTYGYSGSPGTRNPYLYPGSVTSAPALPPVATPVVPVIGFTAGTTFATVGATPGAALTPNVSMPPPIPARRLFQVPDAYAQTITYPPTAPSAGLAIQPPSNASDAGDPFINVTTMSQALGPISPPGMGTTYYPTNGYPVLNWSGNAPAYASTAGTGTTRNMNLGYSSSTNGDYRQHPYFRIEMLQRVMNQTTVRTHQFAVWITIGFFEVKKQGDISMMSQGFPQYAFDIMGPEVGSVTGKGVRYRGFFLVDRTKLAGFNPSNTGSFRAAVVYRRVIQ